MRLLHENGYSTALLVPVPGRDGRSTSLLELYSKTPRTWDDPGLALVQELVTHLAQAHQPRVPAHS